MVAENARLGGARPAVLDDKASYTWGAFALRVGRAAGVLRGLGLRRGERFATLMRNSFRQSELFWAGYWAGIVPVPVNWRLSPAEIAFILEDCECGLVVADREFLHLAESPAVWALRKPLLAVETREGKPAYDALLAQTAPVPAVEVEENDDALLLYTGGTTGRSKGVRLSHRNILSNAWQIGLSIGIRRDDVYSHVAPMFHAADLHGTVAFLLGCRHVFAPQFEPEAIASMMERHRVTIAHWVPTMVKMMTDSEAVRRHDLSSLRLLFYGSSPMPLEWMRAARDRFPNAQLVQNYGLTETSPVLTMLDGDTHARCFDTGETALLGSAGRPVPGLELRVVDDQDRPLAAGEAGEVTVRGPNVSIGYLKRAEENAGAFRGGWFRTGDIGRLDEEGYLYLIDRKKDVVISGGENVYSSEVEAVLYLHPGVSEAAVIGVPDDRLGEALFAVIVPKAGTTLTPEEIIEHCRAYIGGYKIPRRIAFAEILPRTAMGKLNKPQLRSTYAEPRARTGAT